MAKRDGITRLVSPRTSNISYKARFSYADERGVRRHRSKTFGQRQQAKAWLAERRREVDRDVYADPSPLTVAEVAARWLATVTRARAPSTAVVYRQVWERHVAPELGARKVAELRPTTIQTFYDALGRRYAAATVAQVHKVLRGILAHAVTDGIIARNPAEGRRLPADRVEVGATWTPDEARVVARHAETDDEAILVAVLLGTGLRIGEALALAWTDVDLDARTARIHRTVQRSPQGIRIAPMTKTGRPRTIALPGGTVLALRRQRALAPGALVFPGRDGRPLHPSTARRRMGLLCARIGVPMIGLHGIRRCCATMMIVQGVPPSVAARMLGHSVEVMLRLYAATTDEMQRDAADALDAALDPASGDRTTRRGS